MLYFVVVVVLLVGSSHEAFGKKEPVEVVKRAREEMLYAMAGWASGRHGAWSRADVGPDEGSGGLDGAMGDCVKMYEEAERRLARLVGDENCSRDDGLAWLSGALASHVGCMDGLREKGLPLDETMGRNLSGFIREGLAMYGGRQYQRGTRSKGVVSNGGGGGLLTSWDAATSNADLVVAKDGSGNYESINQAVSDLARRGTNRPERVIIYVKSGVYHEKVEIGRNLRNIMFVGDGIDKTIVTGNANVQDGATTFGSATFGVSGDGFWARGITFENTAGPHKHQAVALRSSSDLSIFYQCSFKGYQDTLLVHSLRQFFRDCHIYGTIDFIFGDAAAVFQNCDIFIRRPMDSQANMITAQGRDDPNENTGISVLNSRVSPASDFSDVKGAFRSYLGRPWKKYARAVFLRTEIDGMIDGKGWMEWSGDFALSTLYYAEYMNTGGGASTAGRVKWPGFHALSDASEAAPFSVGGFIGGDAWIPASGVEYWSGI